MARKTVSGVAGVLNHLTGEPADSRQRTAGAPLPDKPVPAEPPARQEKRRTAGEDRGARRGRPPGRRSGDGQLKEKATIWVSAEVMADYRDWSWEERCNLGELIERALADYRRRHRRKA